ncbi:uncharacterized protein LOC126227562 [Schistocerca nitens]|uniref:uncharacterized protein LOC126227562 n=1 Tax=Schistocerca nitens TaxID=7011 RepID=UPI002118D8D7|nr:uncharacterized protein LOC126227562 [Schistocerca nitens]
MPSRKGSAARQQVFPGLAAKRNAAAPAQTPRPPSPTTRRAPPRAPIQQTPPPLLGFLTLSFICASVAAPRAPPPAASDKVASDDIALNFRKVAQPGAGAGAGPALAARIFSPFFAAAPATPTRPPPPLSTVRQAAEQSVPCQPGCGATGGS